MKHKKHYNTFNPKLGFFLHYKDVMEWFDATPSYYDMVRLLTRRLPRPARFCSCLARALTRPTLLLTQKVRGLTSAEYSPLLKEDLECFRCSKTFRTFALLKDHLGEEFQAVKKRAKERYAREQERAARERERQEQAQADETEKEEGEKEGEASRKKRKLDEERRQGRVEGGEDVQPGASTSVSSSQATAVASDAHTATTKSKESDVHDVLSPPRKRREKQPQPVYDVDSGEITYETID